ncbi:glycosyltransferase family 4 protein [Marinilactibacillus psychrotolerans]|uniref:glycosyltransferase family 4 protein n=1 Tax=Marinilactibacillus psychrotolerans TaxID=191770 RepID=UPI00388B485C
MKKKILFISNITNRITNFSLPSILVSHELDYEFHLAANLSDFKDDPTKYNIKIHHIDIARNPLNPNNIKAYKQMITLIKKEKFDAIHCNTPVGGLLGRICGRKAKIPKIIYTVHGFHFYKGASLINRTLFKLAETWMAHYTDAIITINKEDYQAAMRFKLRNGGRVYYLPGVGVDTSLNKKVNQMREKLLQELNIKEPAILLISVGELNKNKNNKVIIHALGKLKNPKLHYILCGRGDKKDELVSLVKENELESNVHFLGYRNDIPQLLKLSDIFIMPSYREGLSRSIMEAMGMGLPCIVSSIRGNVDLIEEEKGGYLSNPDDIERFAQVIDILAGNENLRNNLGKFNLNKVKQFDIKNVREELKKVYMEELM